MRILIFIVKLILLLAPIPLYLIGFPIREQLKSTSTEILGIGIAYLFVLSILYGVKLARWASYPRYQGIINLAFPLLVITSSFLSIVLGIYPPFTISILLCLLSTAVLAHVFAAGNKVKDSGIVSLLCFIALIGSAELSLRSLSPSRFSPEIVKIPALAPSDRGHLFFQSHGFRDRKPCTNCPSDSVRIVTMGGSSTYGIPMHTNAYTYSAELQRLLNQRRANEHYEVLNAGVAGYGIVQVVEALEKDIVKVRPSIVIICSWFNDSAAALGGWYRMGDISDREAENRIKLLRKIENAWPYQLISHSRIYGLMRYYLIAVRDKIKSGLNLQESPQHKGRRKRMKPSEFALELQRVVELGKKYNFVPIFVYEPINRSFSLEEGLLRNKYYQAIKKVADENGVAVVDTLTGFNKRRDEWLFYDFIHPNPEGHKIEAEAIYKTLFESPANDWLNSTLKRDAKN